MKFTRLLFLSLLAQFISTYAHSNGASFPTKLIPIDHQIESAVFADFNKDGLRDAVVITREQSHEKLRIYPDLNSDTYSPTFVNENNWIIHFYFQGADQSWHKALANNNLIPPEYLNGDIPFDGISFDKEKSTLRLRLKYWMSIGSWWTSNEEYTFRYQNDKLELIGYEDMTLHRSSHAGHDLSINFSTGRAHLTQRIAVEGSDIPKEEKSKHDFDLFADISPTLSNFDRDKFAPIIEKFISEKTSGE